jgi:acyl carrier protein
MKTREEIIEQVNSLLAEEFETEDSNFAPDANLKDALNLDSINLVDLIALVQFTYKITIPVEDLKKIHTFNDLYDYIEQHQK